MEKYLLKNHFGLIMMMKAGKKESLKSFIGSLIHQLTHIADSDDEVGFDYACHPVTQEDNAKFQKFFLPCFSWRMYFFFRRALFHRCLEPSFAVPKIDVYICNGSVSL